MVEKAYGLFLLEKAKASEHGALLIKRLEEVTEDYVELKYIYNTEDEQMEHKEFMENSGYRCYQCGISTLYRDYDLPSSSNSNSFFRYDVKVPTSIFGINENGLLHEARLRFGYYKD